MTTSFGTHEELNKHTLSVQKNSRLPSFLIQADSDDDENTFKPPALSDYALALLKKQEKESLTQKLGKNTTTIPKRVNFNQSPTSNKPSEPQPQTQQSHTNTAHSHPSENETIFTKNVNDLHRYSSSSPALSNDKSQKTPLFEVNSLNSNHNDSSNSNITYGSSLRTRSVRRSKMFGSLGPPKRASFSPSVNKAENPQQPNSPVSTANVKPDIEDTPMKDAISPAKIIEQSKDYTTIDFQGMNPYQYARMYGVPSCDLPKLIKMFLEQRPENAESFQSPVRLKTTMYNKIEQEVRHNSPKVFSPKPVKELFKETKQQELWNTYNNKENQVDAGARIKAYNNDAQSRRKPLALLSDNNNNNHQKLKTHQSAPSKATDGEYYERYHKETEPLKEPDYQSLKQHTKLIIVNDKQYEKLELLGKGGSSKVFKVKSLKSKVYAVKKIVFDEFDDASIKGFKGEIDLLIRLRNQERVVRLIDYSLAQGSLLLVMECGDIDLSHVLQKRLDMPMDVEFVRYHSNEILKCVKAVHDAGIVHSDLKPANFLFVKGVLKIIDFGIANAVPDHTVNIYRESQIGTPNYMAPEALIDNNQQGPGYSSEVKSTWRVGKPSDIWSCGCIIYQMIYGRPPYGAYQGSQRLLAIMNPDVKISYPEKGLGGSKVPGTALETIKNCLHRDPGLRWDVDQVLGGSFLKPRIVSESFVNDLVKNAITYGASRNSIDDDELKNLADDVWRRVSRLSL